MHRYVRYPANWNTLRLSGTESGPDLEVKHLKTFKLFPLPPAVDAIESGMHTRSDNKRAGEFNTT